MSELHFDDAAAKRLLALYRTPDVARTREAFLRALAPQPGERVLDVGCGPGFLAGLIADAVGPSGAVTGIDVSEPLLAVARSHCANKPWVVLQHGDAMRLAFADARASGWGRLAPASGCFRCSKPSGCGRCTWAMRRSSSSTASLWKGVRYARCASR